MQSGDHAFVVARLHLPADPSDRAAVAAAWPPDTLGFSNLGSQPAEQQKLDPLNEEQQQGSQQAGRYFQPVDIRGNQQMLVDSLEAQHAGSGSFRSLSQSPGSMVLKLPGIQGAVLVHRQPPDS